MEGDYEVEFYGGPADGLCRRLHLPFLGAPSASTVVTYDTAEWRYYYLVEGLAEPLKARHARTDYLPSDACVHDGCLDATDG